VTGVDLFGAYVRERLDHWGREFAFFRDWELLGHKSKDMLAVLIEHAGEMPPRPTGFRPFHVDLLAMQVEDCVREVFHAEPVPAWAIRAYYCGEGRRGVERYDLFRALAKSTASRSTYYRSVDRGTDLVRAKLLALARTVDG
jgi:hypothetical protein